MKEILDQIPSASFYPIFHEFTSRLQRAKVLEQFKFLDEGYLIPLDGTQYFSSECISCPSCLAKDLKNGKTLFYHQVVAATIAHPNMRQVLSLAPEPIKNEDGSKKQDCERNAGKRLVKRIRETHPKLKIIILGDDLYANGPFAIAAKNERMSFFSTCSHFFIHQISELTDSYYQKCRSAFSSRKKFWNQLRCTIRILVLPSWEELLLFITSPPMEPALPP
ncbi:hypothetical protein QUF70_12610 [Desulfobacterales bacterium HSG17]|nr:hypothetical protein [Desulfobacterales bacterium HSG17]